MRVPLFPFPDESEAVVPAPSSNLYQAIGFIEGVCVGVEVGVGVGVGVGEGAGVPPPETFL